MKFRALFSQGQEMGKMITEEEFCTALPIYKVQSHPISFDLSDSL